MSISFAEERPWACSNCGTVTTTLTWLAIDLAERSDLRDFLAGETWERMSCPVCGTVVGRGEPLLVTRLAGMAPVILAMPDALLPASEPPESFHPVIDRVRTALGSDLRDVPGPLLVVPFDALAIAASRDLDADAVSPGGMIDYLDVSSEPRKRYVSFLEDITKTSSHRRLHLALNRLRVVESRDDLERLALEFPELGSREAQDELSRWVEGAGDDQERQVARSQLILARAIAAGDQESGWERYEVALHKLWEEYVRPRLDRLTAQFDRRWEAHEWAGVAEVGREIIALVKQGGMYEPEAIFSATTASALWHIAGEGRAERIEEIIALLERVLEILDAHPEFDQPTARTEALLNLGASYGARLRHDPAANQERAIVCLRQALELIPEEDGATKAMAHTNLGLSLLERFRDEDSRQDAVQEAIAHFEAALTWRSFEHDPLDWAYTEINLGLAFARAREGDRRSNIAQAIEHFEQAAKGFAAAGEKLLQAQAMHNLSSSKFDQARLEDTAEAERVSLLREAEAAARASLRLGGVTDSSVEAGRTWDRLARILEESGDRAGAVEAFKLALHGVTPQTDPRTCREAARSLAALAAEGGDWALASDAWETAVEAAVAAAESRATVEGRFRELTENLNIFRWAAYALTRVGRLERAVEVLELGRARELASWLHRDVVDLDRVALLNPDLSTRFAELRSRLDQLDHAIRSGTAIAGAVEAAATAESFRATLEEIRKLPGLANFLDRPFFGDIAAAARPGAPIAYVITSPEGSAVLLVWNEHDERPQVELIDSPDLTSTELVRLIFQVDQEAGTVGGYGVAQAGERDDLDAFLDDLGSLIGPSLLKPLDEALARKGATTVCMVPVMLMGLLPLHALSWNDPTGSRSLIDDFEIVFAPSATVRSVCLRRATLDHRERRLLAVGNPLPHPSPLGGAEFEVRAIAESFSRGTVELLVGRAATKQAVIDRLPGISHVHFACHGWADSRGEVLTAFLSLANDERLSAGEIVDIEGVCARLVVASACQTAVVQGYEAADEVLGLATAFIGAGATGVVATLWPVDDYGTALLMTRFYETLADATEPAAALRAAQRWLRTMTLEEEEAYVLSHPALREHRESRAGTAAQAARSRAATNHPYSAPSQWGAFVFTGA